MQRNRISAFMTILVVLLVFMSHITIEAKKITDIKEGTVEIQMDSNEDNEFEIDVPDVSGPVRNLPWARDEDFLKAKEENNAHILMAAYCSVLIDPLPGESHNVNLAAKSAKGIVIQPGGVFSQNQLIGPYTGERGYKMGTSFAGTNLVKTEGGGVCKIATTLYNVAILSDLEIVERHNHSMPVNYVPYGQDATVAYGNKDFRFRNNYDFPILIWSEIIGHRLYMGIYGRLEPPHVEWVHEITNLVDFPVYYRTNPELKEGEEKVVIKGIRGATVKSKVIIRYNDGTTKVKDLGTSFYHPLPKVIERRD